MGLFSNPLGHAGYPPGVTGTPTTQPSAVRAATAAEVAAGVLDSVYISPSTLGEFLDPAIATTGATPRVANGRVAVATFSGVSIAAAATQAFVIQNSFIEGASTNVLVSMVGATSGSALSIQSVVNAVGQTTITVTNGTGATTTVANITFTVLVLN